MSVSVRRPPRAGDHGMRRVMEMLPSGFVLVTMVGEERTVTLLFSRDRSGEDEVDAQFAGAENDGAEPAAD